MAFSVLYSVKDGKDATSTFQINLPAATDFLNAIAFAEDMALLVDALLGGQITRIGIAFEVDLPAGLASSPAITSDVEEGARFQFRTDGGFFTGIRLPTFLETFIQTGSKLVDTSAAAVLSFITAMTDGIDVDPGAPVVTVAPSDTREDDITTLESAKEQFQSSRST